MTERTRAAVLRIKELEDRQDYQQQLIANLITRVEKLESSAKAKAQPPEAPEREGDPLTVFQYLQVLEGRLEAMVSAQKADYSGLEHLVRTMGTPMDDRRSLFELVELLWDDGLPEIHRKLDQIKALVGPDKAAG